MSNYKYSIPNTEVGAEIITPRNGNPFAPIFLGKGDIGNGEKMSSVNAGTSNYGSVFAVGLGGINGGFASVLKKAGQNPDEYQKIHHDLYDGLKKGKLSAAKHDFISTDPVKLSMIQKPNPSFNLPEYDGITFVDIFNEKQVPHGNILNYCMIYVVPPNSANYDSKESFLLAIKATSVTIVEALAQYNSKYAFSGNKLGLEVIKDLRMCLYSGGIYRGNATSKDEVAKSNLEGLESGFVSLGKNNEITLVEFEFSNVIQWLSTGVAV